MLNAHLKAQPYLVGKELTLADFSVAAPLFYADRASIPLAAYANIKEWFGRVPRCRAGPTPRRSRPLRRRRRPDIAQHKKGGISRPSCYERNRQQSGANPRVRTLETTVSCRNDLARRRDI